ncbi:MAG: YncE family protein [Chitinispirillaceae bacterium]
MSSVRNSVLICAAVVVAVLFTRCSTNLAGVDDYTGGPKLFISESGSESGLLEWASVEDDEVKSAGLSIYSDAVLKSFGGYLYIIERFGADNIIKFDPSENDQSGIIYQKHLGDNWNPQDMEFVSETKAYVSNMNEPNITVFNPSTGEIISHIDISAYTYMPDSNSSPYANDLQLVGADLYVMLQRRNGFNPGAVTLLLKIDTAEDEVADTIPLQFKNGYEMAYNDGALYICNPGSSFSTGDGAVEKVDLSTNKVSTVIDETALGGNPNRIVHKSGSRFYITNYIDWKNVSVVEIDAESGTVVTVLPKVKDAFGGIHYDAVDEKLYVGERDTDEMGVRVYQNNKQVGSTIKGSNSLPPTDITVVR